MAHDERVVVPPVDRCVALRVELSPACDQDDRAGTEHDDVERLASDLDAAVRVERDHVVLPRGGDLPVTEFVSVHSTSRWRGVQKLGSGSESGVGTDIDSFGVP
jgi:hypothetical protein